jgi:hypothetical protein
MSLVQPPSNNNNNNNWEAVTVNHDEKGWPAGHNMQTWYSVLHLPCDGWGVTWISILQRLYRLLSGMWCKPSDRMESINSWQVVIADVGGSRYKQMKWMPHRNRYLAEPAPCCWTAGGLLFAICLWWTVDMVRVDWSERMGEIKML